MNLNKFWNTQRYRECSLISIWNAAMWHGLDVQEQYDADYMRIIKTAGALTTDKKVKTRYLYMTLGLDPNPIPFEKQAVIDNLPIQACVHSGSINHATLVVAYEDPHFLVANFHQDSLRRVTWEELMAAVNHDIKLINWRKR